MKRNFLLLATFIFMAIGAYTLVSCINANGEVESPDNYLVDRTIEASFNDGSHWSEIGDFEHAKYWMNQINSKLSSYYVSKEFWHDSIATNLYISTCQKVEKEVQPMLDSLVMCTGYDDFSVTVYYKSDAITVITKSSITPSLQASNLYVYKGNGETNVTLDESVDIVSESIGLSSREPIVRMTEEEIDAAFESLYAAEVSKVQPLLDKLGRSDAYFDVILVGQNSKSTKKYTRRITPTTAQ